MVRLGIVMPVLNCLRYSQEAFYSLLAPTPAHWYVIDQASTDGTDAYFGALPRVTLLRQSRNIGVAAAWNLGIATVFAQGEEVALVVNNDLVAAPDTVANLLRWIVEEGEIFVTARAVVGAGPEILQTYARVHEWQPAPCFVCFALTPAVLDQLGGPLFDEGYAVAYYEDNDAHERMLARGIRAGSVGDALVFHRESRTLHEGGVALGEAVTRNQRRFFETYGYIPSEGPRPASLPPLPPPRGARP